MSVEQLASRLGDVFNLLTSGSRTALPRQQTLRALIEWSYDLLSDSEKALFRGLSAFSGGWSLEAAEAVCSVDGGASVLDDLARLVDKSLVNKQELDGEARLEMEHDNLRAAIKWSIEQKHVEQALRIPSALAYFWEIRGYDEEGRNWFKQAVTLEAQ